MASMKDNPILADLDQLAVELEKTGNADLATLVDECSAELLSSPKKAKRTAKSRKNTRRSKKNRKSAGATRARNKQRIAAAMRRIARAQVEELDSIARELHKSGDKHAALEVSKIAADLEEEYEYSSENGHSEPDHKGDASKQYNRDKDNMPETSGDSDPHTDDPYAEGEGFPFGDSEKKEAFASSLGDLIRLAMEDPSDEEDMDLDMDLEDGDDEDSDDDLDMDLDMDLEDGDEDDMEDSEDDEDMDLDMEDSEDDEDMDLDMEDDSEEDEADDELAAMMEAMGMDDDEDSEAASRMYEADEDPDDLDLDALEMGDEDDMDISDDEEDMDMDMEDEEDAEDSEEDMDMDMEDDEEDMDMDMEKEASLGAFSISSKEDKKKVARLAKALWNKGNKDAARRVAALLKKASK